MADAFKTPGRTHPDSFTAQPQNPLRFFDGDVHPGHGRAAAVVELPSASLASKPMSPGPIRPLTFSTGVGVFRLTVGTVHDSDTSSGLDSATRSVPCPVPNETGAGTQNLAVQGSASNSLVSTLGVGVTAPIQLEQKDQTLIPRMSVSWRHDYLAANPATTSVTAGLVSFPEVGTVTAQGQNLGPDSLNLTASLELQMDRNVSLYGGADYQVATNSTQFGYSGGVRVKF